MNDRARFAVLGQVLLGPPEFFARGGIEHDQMFRGVCALGFPAFNEEYAAGRDGDGPVADIAARAGEDSQNWGWPTIMLVLEIVICPDIQP